jgi:aspartate/methionine/tyrosine aminotransferase
VVVNPNNPTGSFLKHDELRELLQLCSERELAIISDEVFSDYSFAPDPQRVASLASIADTLTFCLSGLSKIAGLPQMKLGWIVLAGPAKQCEAARERLELIADTYLSVSTSVQHAAPSLLAAAPGLRRQIQDRVSSNLSALRAAVSSASPCRVLDVEGGWYATVEMPRTRSEEQWCLELLKEDDVLVQPGFFFDFESEAYLVVSLLTPEATFQEGIRKLFLRASSL